MPIAPKFTGGAVESADSGIMWSAIIGGAVASLGLSLILAPLGTALGLAVISPWHQDPNRTITMMSAVWLMIVQWVSFGLGGYLTGRLRTEWVGAHTHEVFFRDTAHGFLTFALVSTLGATLLLLTTIMATPPHAIHANGTPSGNDVTGTALFVYSLSMFIGAFVASTAGALGGHDRDKHYATGRFVD